MKTGTVPYYDKPVSKIVCGTDWLMSTVPYEAFKSLNAYWEAGGRTFDTAHIYGANTNIFGAWTTWAGVKDEVIYFDKGCHPMGGRKRVTAEDTLSDIRDNHIRLGVEHTDFFVFHRDNEEVPVGEIVDWMNEYVKQGLISAFGGSNWRHERIAEANAYAEANGKQGFSLSNPNLTLAHSGHPLWPDCLTIGEEGRAWHKESGLPLFSWSSTARGYFAGTTDPDVVSAYGNEISQGRLERATELGKKYGLSPVQVALAWVLNQPGQVFALCGLRTVDNVKENVAVLDLELTQAELDYLEHGTPLE